MNYLYHLIITKVLQFQNGLESLSNKFSITNKLFTKMNFPYADKLPIKFRILTFIVVILLLAYFIINIIKTILVLAPTIKTKSKWQTKKSLKIYNKVFKTKIKIEKPNKKAKSSNNENTTQTFLPKSNKKIDLEDFDIDRFNDTIKEENTTNEE